MKKVSGLLWLVLLGAPAVAQEEQPDWQDPVWAEIMATPPAASELAISEVTPSRAERLAEGQKASELALAAGDWAGAEQRLLSLLAEYPDAHSVRLKLASLQYGRGALAQARALLQQGLALAPAQAELRLTLARILASERRHAAAWKVLDGATPSLAEHLDYYGLKAEAGRRSNQCEAAIALYHRLLAVQDSGPWWLGLGLCQRRLGQDFTAAFEQARASVDLGVASLQFVNQQLEQHGTTQTH
ncbi:tetratricopeptide repeat protein [Oceanimonas pelagia]|uniref:Tetratricopeptide repeat protein n=1 Tax=Oceanimonas pelagia TaxID=3028314 RepID=A0AA50KQS8_9GAMM|nr:tetratricopeptide repeat protein [Oceanimonas pelagia]WMC12300.1 tetratricopeptide repeat protein [Oceanimonas pelagia]